MDDFIQVLIFLVTFIIFIVSAVRKQKKKSGGKSSSFESVIESFFGVQEKNTPEQQIPQYEQQENQFEQQIISDTNISKRKADKPLYKEGVDAIPNRDDYNYLEKETEEEDDESEFDLQSAVIYSEILNRRTF